LGAEHKREGRGWQGRLEETTEGWLWYAHTEHTGGEGKPRALGFGHSHMLAVLLSRRLANAGMPKIPEELCESAKTMREAPPSMTWRTGCGSRQ